MNWRTRQDWFFNTRRRKKELLRKKKHNKKYNNNNNNDNNNSNDRIRGGINDNKTESVGAIVHKDNNTRTMEIILRLVVAGHCVETTCGEIMTGEEFNNMIDEEEYNKECDAQLCGDGPMG